MVDQEQAVISGSVERVTYYNEENGYTVLRVKPDGREMLPFKYASGRDALITVIGNLPELTPGEWVKIGGRWGTHPKHGRQFLAEKLEQGLPATATGIKRYLGSGLIRGVGRVMAERIVDQFGEDTLEVIEAHPERLKEVPGIGAKRIAVDRQSVGRTEGDQRRDDLPPGPRHHHLPGNQDLQEIRG